MIETIAAALLLGLPATYLLLCFFLLIYHTVNWDNERRYRHHLRKRDVIVGEVLYFSTFGLLIITVALIFGLALLGY